MFFLLKGSDSPNGIIKQAESEISQQSLNNETSPEKSVDDDSDDIIFEHAKGTEESESDDVIVESASENEEKMSKVYIELKSIVFIIY